MSTRIRNTLRLASLATTTALILTACGGDGGEDQGDAAAETGAAEEGDAIERPDLRVGVTPSLTFASVYFAVEEGIFEEHGLNVEIVDKGSSDVPPLLADEYQVGTMASATYIQAVAEGFELRALYPGVDGHTGAISIMAMPDSGIETIEDLEGRTVAINQPSAAFEIFTRILLENTGVGQDNVDFSVIPFSSMVEALAGGQVDSAVLTAPFNTIAANEGAEVVADVFEGELEGAPIAGFTVIDDFVQENPNTVAAFVDAMDQAVEELNGLSDEEYAEFLPTFTSIDPEIAGQVVRPEYPTRVDIERMQALADRMSAIGVLRNEVDLAPTVVEVDAP